MRVFVSKKKWNWSVRWTEKRAAALQQSLYICMYTEREWVSMWWCEFWHFKTYSIHNWHCHIQCEYHFIHLTIHSVRSWVCAYFEFWFFHECGVECRFVLFFLCSLYAIRPLSHCDLFCYANSSSLPPTSCPTHNAHIRGWYVCVCAHSVPLSPPWFPIRLMKYFSAKRAHIVLSLYMYSYTHAHTDQRKFRAKMQ